MAALHCKFVTFLLQFFTPFCPPYSFIRTLLDEQIFNPTHPFGSTCLWNLIKISTLLTTRLLIPTHLFDTWVCLIGLEKDKIKGLKTCFSAINKKFCFLTSNTSIQNFDFVIFQSGDLPVNLQPLFQFIRSTWYFFRVWSVKKIRSKIWTWKKQGAKKKGHCYLKR